MYFFFLYITYFKQYFICNLTLYLRLIILFTSYRLIYNCFCVTQQYFAYIFIYNNCMQHNKYTFDKIDILTMALCRNVEIRATVKC